MRKVEIEWIPTKERLPDKSDCYLVSIKNSVRILCWRAPINECDGYWFADDGIYFNYVASVVEAWAYFPEPYKED